MLGDIRLDPWDIVTVDDGEGTYKIPVMNIQQEYDGGLSMTITSYGKTQTEQEVDFKGPTTQQNERIYSELMLTKELIAKKVDAEWVKANTVQAETITSIDRIKANVAGITLPFTFLVACIVAIWLICNEIISILENINDIGVTLPPFLQPIVSNLKSQVEQKASIDDIKDNKESEEKNYES